MNNEINLKPFKDSLNTIKTSIQMIKDEIIIRYQLYLEERIEFSENIISNRKRVIGLWENTCFEFFLKNKITGEYLEFNFSGTGLFNVFYFKKQKQELKEYPDLKILKHRFRQSPKYREFIFSFNISSCSKNLQELKQLIGAPTVILNNEDNEKQFFAIEHFGKTPDFHNDKAFKQITDLL